MTLPSLRSPIEGQEHVLKKKVLAGSVNIAAAAMLLVGTAPANAALTNCPPTAVCLWTEDNGTGTMGAWGSTSASVGVTHNDNDNSLANKRATSIVFSENINFSGRNIRFPAGATHGYLYLRTDNLGLGETWRDRISSFQP